jgi:hypothetical protein
MSASALFPFLCLRDLFPFLKALSFPFFSLLDFAARPFLLARVTGLFLLANPECCEKHGIEALIFPGWTRKPESYSLSVFTCLDQDLRLLIR